MLPNINPSDVQQIFSKLPVGAPAVEVWFNGLYTCLVFATIYMFVLAQFKAKNPGNSKRRVVSWVIVLGSMYFFATVHSTISIVTELRDFQFHGGDPSILNAFIDQSPLNKGFVASMFVATGLIADCLFIWRCWVVWERRWIFVVVPILTMIAGAVLSILGIIGQVQVASERSPGVVPEHFVALSTPFFILSLVTSLYSTVFIALRVFLVQREMKILGFNSQFKRHYSRMVEIVVESALLNSINLIALVVLTVRKSDKLDWPQDIQPQIAGIAPTLILLRVALGHARPDTEWSFAQTRSLGEMIFAKQAALPVTTDETCVQSAMGSQEKDLEKSPKDLQLLPAHMQA
ncbi:hypothetical protein SCHPADRAFT_945646 [Schizopora paradoxa]|uniref:Uncharacterized protein n=1 Tax=Schizopora paradoxa TaxID=27342 RepID=A0A0H2R5B4_9AGAM|nr:hypothetical protein SCHPADRAFT_945646 [Schizopora paradoxa]